MKQEATVKRILSNGKAEVWVKRQGACGHKCSDCHGCEQLKTADPVVVAENRVNAKSGDTVIVESGNAPILTAAAIVYLLPFGLFFIFYGIAASLSIGSGWLPVVLGLTGFALGILISMAWDRRVKRNNRLQFWITDIKK